MLPGTNHSLLVDEAHNHIEVALHWDALLAEAQYIPGFQDFLRFPKALHLLSAAHSHPMAIINLYKSCCDALILKPGSDTTFHIPLPNFSTEAAFATWEQLATLVGLQELAQPNKFHLQDDALHALWVGIVEPVLDFLGYMHKHLVDTLPQITWCTTGSLSFLLLHAAGPYTESWANAFDCVISSYMPTVSALLAAQHSTPETHSGVLGIRQEHTPGLSLLPHTKAKLANVRKHAQAGCYLQLERKEAVVDLVMDAMEQFSWVHMACHSTQNLADPMQSTFHLHDGPLTLATITKWSFSNKGLAFLLACQTATCDQKMPDKAVHLAAGTLMVGYPSVIGTMWSIANQDGPVVADIVYVELIKGDKIDHTKEAWALHRVVAHLCAKAVREIGQWALYIHIGS